MSMKKIQTNIFICIIVFISGSANAGSYEDGIVAYSRRDYQTASKLFRNGADRGDSKAQYQLSIMYDKGQGVTQDYKEALRLVELSAEKGNDSAQLSLGFIYDVGRGVTQSYEKAFAYYRRSADQNNHEAQFYVGFSYAHGKGVGRDYVKAHMWYNISAAMGYKFAENARDEIELKYMTKTQIEKAQDMARQCIEKNYKNCD